MLYLHWIINWRVKVFGIFSRKTEKTEESTLEPHKEFEPFEPTYPLRKVFDSCKDSAQFYKREEFEKCATFSHSPICIKYTFLEVEYCVSNSILGRCALLTDDAEDNRLDWLSMADLKWLHQSLLDHLREKEREKQLANRQYCVDMLTTA